MQKVIVEVRKNYGVDIIYPVCENAMRFARLANKKTLSPSDITIIRELGFFVEHKQIAVPTV